MPLAVLRRERWKPLTPRRPSSQGVKPCVSSTPSPRVPALTETAVCARATAGNDRISVARRARTARRVRRGVGMRSPPRPSYCEPPGAAGSDRLGRTAAANGAGEPGRTAMQIGMVGLGRMGANMVRRLLRGGHACAVYDRDPSPVKELAGEGAQGTGSLDELGAALSPPRVVWLMLPAGQVTETAVAALKEKLSSGDVVIDGGNSYFKDDVRRAGDLAQKGIHYVDAGTSGGIWGLERGYCMMIGGDRGTVARLDPIWKTLAPGTGAIPPTPGRAAGTAEQGYLHCGPVGAGHFVKM